MRGIELAEGPEQAAGDEVEVAFVGDRLVVVPQRRAENPRLAVVDVRPDRNEVVLGFLAIFRANLRPRRWGWVISRGVFGGIAVLLYFTCIEKIGVGIATLLNYTAPVWSMTATSFAPRDCKSTAVLAPTLP